MGGCDPQKLSDEENVGDVVLGVDGSGAVLKRTASQNSQGSTSKITSVHLTRLSQNAIQRMAHIAGIPRICVKCYDNVRDVIRIYLLKRLQEIISNASAKTVGFDRVEGERCEPVDVGEVVVEFSKSGFEAIVRDLAKQLGNDGNNPSRKTVRFHKALFDDLQTEVEAHVLRILKRSKIIMDHSNRRVVYPKDVLFVVNELLI